jgi:hypothetical protein
MEITNKRYVLANIKIPLEIKEDGAFEPLSDCISISIEKINDIPKKSENNNNNEYIKEQIALLFKESNILPIISNDELTNRNHRTHKKNISFRNKKSHFSRYTVKNYDTTNI